MSGSTDEPSTTAPAEEMRLFRLTGAVKTDDGVAHQLGDVVPLTRAQYRELRPAQVVEGAWDDAEIAPPPILPERRAVRVKCQVVRERAYKAGELITVTLPEFRDLARAQAVEGDAWEDAERV